MQISRRGLLAGAAAGGGLVVAWYLFPRDYSEPLAAAEGERAFGAWLKIAQDGVITVAVPQLEMGQGITTLIPQIIAVELGADWRQIAVEPAPVSGVYANVPLAAKWSPLWLPHLGGATDGLADDEDDLIAQRFAERSRFSATSDGTSLEAYELPARSAAASARALLAMAAAEQWEVPWEECEAAGGFIIHGTGESERRASFAELAESAAEQTPPEIPPLRSESASETPIPGRAGANTEFPRLDLPAKVDGSYLFAGDIRLPGMVYAAIRHGPGEGPVLARYDPAKVAGNPQLVGLVDGKRWLAAIATNWWEAERALEVLKPVFRVVSAAYSENIDEALDNADRKGPAYRVATRGDGDAGMEKPSIALRYHAAPALHAGLETATATGRLENGRLELWLASQAPEAARQAAAEAVGLSLDNVVLYPMPAGGSFDARLDHEHAIQVAKIAQQTGKPVQLMWSRWQEQLRTIPRAPATAVLSAKTGPAGEIQAMRTTVAMPAPMVQFGERLFGGSTRRSAEELSRGKVDPMALDGAMPHYAIPNAAVNHAPATIVQPTGKLRGSSHGMTAFFNESFIDEIASRNGREPLSFRIEMLGNDLRMVGCLQRAARLAEWGGGGDGSGQGLACHRIGDLASGGRIACVATARRASGEGTSGAGVRIEKISAAVDIGRIVNLDIARQQIEGGLIFGIGLALGASTGYQQGRPTLERLAELNLPRLADCPEIEVDFVASQEAPFDPGELGVAVAAPAIANALFSATGLRLRRLPLFSEGL